MERTELKYIVESKREGFVFNVCGKKGRNIVKGERKYFSLSSGLNDLTPNERSVSKRSLVLGKMMTFSEYSVLGEK